MKMQVHNLIILDESGSMEMIKNETISGFQQLGERIRANSQEFSEQEHLVSLVTFNGLGIKTCLDKQPAIELINLNSRNYRPNSNTPLYDAICKSVLSLRYDLYHLEDYRVLVTVITDGMENMSTEFSEKEAKLLIEKMSADKRWGFGLIGAGIDVSKVAASLSIPQNRTIEFEHCSESVDAMFKRYGAAQRVMAERFANYDDFDDDIPF